MRSVADNNLFFMGKYMLRFNFYHNPNHTNLWNMIWNRLVDYRLKSALYRYFAFCGRLVRFFLFVGEYVVVIRPFKWLALVRLIVSSPACLLLLEDVLKTINIYPWGGEVTL